MDSELDNLNNGLIELLNKKYNINIYIESNSHKLKTISKQYLKNNINFDKDLTFEITEEYIKINPKLCYYDIDILNIIIKFIIKNRQLVKYIHRNMDFYDKFLDFFGYYKPLDPNKSYRKTLDYFDKPQQTINIKLKDIYSNICKNIIVKYSK